MEPQQRPNSGTVRGVCRPDTKTLLRIVPRPILQIIMLDGVIWSAVRVIGIASRR